MWQSTESKPSKINKGKNIFPKKKKRKQRK